MKIIKVQNQDNRPDLIRSFELSDSQWEAVEKQLEAGIDIIEVPRNNGAGLIM